MFISNVETDIVQVSNELHNTDDVLDKAGESYEEEKIADEFVVLEEIHSDGSVLNIWNITQAI